MPLAPLQALARHAPPASFTWPHLPHPSAASGDDLTQGFKAALSCLTASLVPALAPRATAAALAALVTVGRVASANRVELALLYVYLYDVVSRRSVVELLGLVQLLGGAWT